jgi:uncharacterized repeat protein (TIGR03803 family)
MKKIQLLLLPVFLLSFCHAHAQGELWGVGEKIFKVDGNNPAPANCSILYTPANPAMGSGLLSLTAGGNGKLYGTTSTGGVSNRGVLFEYDPATATYTAKVLFDEINGKNGGPLTLAPNGKLYGVTWGGGAYGGTVGHGVLFEYDPATGIYTKKFDFDGTGSGREPRTPLTLASNGKFYGMTNRGGTSDLGVLYEYDFATNIYTKKVDFNGTANGSGPYFCHLTLAANNKLYGLTEGGGTSNQGVLFEYDPAANVLTKKFDFSSAALGGANPFGGLTLAGNGKFYGGTDNGGTVGAGVLFEYDFVTNTYAVRHNFLSEDAGIYVRGLTLTPNGKLFGVTGQFGGVNDNGYGALFEYDPASGTLTKKIQFDGSATLPAEVPHRLLYVIPQPAISGFAAIPIKTYGDAPFTVSASGGASGNPVTFSSSNTAVATVSGNTVTIVGGGTASIIASQAGNATYLSAPNASQTLTVNKAGQSITFGALATKTFGDAAFALTGTASSGLAVSYASSNTAVATVSGNMVTIVGAGTATITASQAGNANYNAAADVPQTLTVNKQNQAITFGALAAKTFGDAAFNLTATGGTSGNAVTFASSNTAVATISGNTVTIEGAGATTITASQAGNANYNAAADVLQTLTVNKQNQTITFGALSAKTFGDIPFTVSATGGTSGNAITFSSSNTSVATVSGNVVTIVGAGTANIIASQAGNANYNAAADVPQTLTVNKASQSITFNALATRTMGDAPFVLSATGGASGNQITFASSNPAVATILGNVVTIVGAGTTTITASQPANANYSAAPDVPQLLTVNKGNQTITFGALSSKTFGDTPFTLTGTASSGLAVSYVSSNTGVATVSGSTLTIVGAGTTTITASQAGNVNYNAAANVLQTLTVNKANQTITFFPMNDKTTGAAPFNLTATASSGLAVSYASSNTAVATVSGNTVTIVGAGSTTITASQPGNASYNAAASVPQTLTVTSTTKTDQTITFNVLTDKNTGDAPFALTATATSGLPVSFSSSNTAVATVAGNTVTVVGAGSTIITASQPGDATYNAATPVSQLLTVNKLNQTITFNTLADKTVGDAAFNLTATASSALAISYTSSNTSVATIAGNTVNIVGAGTTVITASQSGNASFNAATSVAQTLTVNKVGQTITFNTLASKVVGDTPFSLTATASSGLAVSYTSSNSTVATVSGSTVTIVGAGTTIFTASQSGNASYNSAPSVPRDLIVNRASQTITFNTLASKTVGDAAFNLTATASSGLTVTYTSSNTSVATVSGNTVTIVGAGTAVITASQSGNASFNAAGSVNQTLTVNRQNQSITFTAPSSKLMGDAPFNLTATASSGLPVSYIIGNPAVATISGSTVTIVGVGSTLITATQSGNATFNAAVNVYQFLTVSKASQTITFAQPANKLVTDAAFDLGATASSGLPVSYTSSTPSVATVSGSTVTIVGSGTTTITASQGGDANFNAANSVPRNINVSRLSQTITFGALASKTFGDANFNLTATASSGLAVSYTSSNTSVAVISGSTVFIVGTGSTNITASQAGNATYNGAPQVSQSLTINKADQTITFNALADQYFGGPAYMLFGTTSSGLAIHYTSSNPAVATVSGNTVYIAGVGTTNITASQIGNGNYNAATAVVQALTVNKGIQMITFNLVDDRTIGDPPLILNATGGASGNPVTYTSSDPAVASMLGNALILWSAGTVTITASQEGNANYDAAPQETQTLTVHKADQVIDFPALAAQSVGYAPFDLLASTPSLLDLTFTSSNTSVATVSGYTVTIVGAGTATITASQAGDNRYNAAADVQQTLTVNKGDQTITFNALANKTTGDTPFALTATTSSGLAVSYASSNAAVATIVGNTVTIVGAGTTIITASQSGNANFNAATAVAQIFTVTSGTQLNQTIAFDPIPDFSFFFGDGPFNLTATASSGLPVSYASSNESVATISGNTVTIMGAGVTIITASQAGNTSYHPANDVMRALTVGLASQDITFNALPDKTFGDPAFTLTATASSGLPISYESSNPAVAVVSGNMVTILGAGTTVITAWQGGNRNYDAPNNVDQTLTVNKAAQTIIFNVLTNRTVGDAAFDLAAMSTAALPVSYASSNPSVATITGNTVTIVGAGTAIITASQPGNTNYNPATDVQQTLTVNNVKANQTITFDALVDKNVGDAAFDLTATASSGLAVNFASSNTSVATIAGNTVTIVGAGTTIITASQAGNANYNAAPDVLRILTVNNVKQNQTITFNTPADRTLGDSPMALSAIASSGLAVVFQSTSTKISISGNQATLISAGRVSITAVQAGNTSFHAATSVERSFCIKPAKPTITLANADTESPTLTSSATTGNQWFKDGVAIAGATNATFNVTQPGVYKVQVKVDDCTSDFSNDQAIIVTGDIEISNTSIQLYPNPASEWLTVSLGADGGTKEVGLYDLNGKQTDSQNVSGSEAKFYVGGYTSATYLVKVKMGGEVKVVRFVKK